MEALFTLLPLYLFGNLHCAGMCGPLVMLLAKHPHRWGYFLGRLVAFSLAGAASAEMGVALFSFLAKYHISALFSLLFGIWILYTGTLLLFALRSPGGSWLAKRGAHLAVKLSKLMGQGFFAAIFLFGACTIILPCGQLIIVFSIIALKCSPLMGLVNGALFALCTSPGLIAAMHASRWTAKLKGNYRFLMGIGVVLIGFLALLRGVADFGWINHLVINAGSPSRFHIALF